MGYNGACMKKSGGQKRKLISCLLLACLLTGCASKGAAPANNDNTLTSVPEKTAMLAEARTEYKVPESYPAVSVDLIGYTVGTEKKAVIRAKELPKTFVLKNAVSGEKVFEGKVKPIEDADSEGMCVGVADFSEIDEEGTYYIETEYLGDSKEFKIKTGVYDELLSRTFGKLHALRANIEYGTKSVPAPGNSDETLDVSGGWKTGENGQKDVVTGCMAAYDLMVAYQYHPSSFGDDMGISESGNRIPDILDEIMFETDWLLKMQNPETGGVYTAVSSRKTSTGRFEPTIDGEATRATVYFCVVMTHFSYVINKFNSAYASKCLKAAGLAWKCLEANKNLVSSEQMYRAAVELYKATGYAVYKKVIDEYLKSNADKDLTDRTMVDAAITHMSTTRNADMDLCGKLMERFMARTHSKAAKARDCGYMVESADMTPEELLRNTEELVVVDYIISSLEYEKMEENYLHYMCGRNIKSELYLDFEYDPDGYAMLLVLLGRLTDKK